MLKCTVTITTAVDGKENKISREGELLLENNRAELLYTEENAVTRISFVGGVATVTRQGDYSLSLIFKKGETTGGTLGLGGAQGEIYTRTERLGYSIGDSSFMLFARYDLLTAGGEPQKMKIRVFAKAH